MRWVLSSQKKRVVYTYPEPWNTVFKMLTWLLYKYDCALCTNCYSFRRTFTAHAAVSDAGGGKPYGLKDQINRGLRAARPTRRVG